MAKTKAITAPTSAPLSKEVEEAATILGEACEILRSQLESLDSGLAHGTYRLLSGAFELLNDLANGATDDELEEVSAALACALAVFEALLNSEGIEKGGPNFIPAYGAHRLAAIAKANIDAVVGNNVAEARHV